MPDARAQYSRFCVARVQCAVAQATSDESDSETSSSANKCVVIDAATAVADVATAVADVATAFADVARRCALTRVFCANMRLHAHMVRERAQAHAVDAVDAREMRALRE